MKEILDQLGLSSVNDGTWFGAEPRSDESAPLIESSNPTTNELIASVRATTMEQYEDVIAKAQESFLVWRSVPAPVRGEAVRHIANALRKHKDALGSLVALENGKIKAEGDGEVQEMIDIADFAVGQSRSSARFRPSTSRSLSTPGMPALRRSVATSTSGNRRRTHPYVA